MPSGQLIAPTSINDLPYELKQLLASFLTNHDPLQASQDILKLRTLSHEWNRIVMSYLKWLWNKKVSDGWLDDFLKQEQNTNLQLQNFQQSKTLTLAPQRSLHALNNQKQTNHVIRQKIAKLKTLIEKAGLEVPATLKNFPTSIELESTSDRELELEIALQEIEHMAGGKKQMTASQKTQIKNAIAACLQSKEHKKGARGSTKGTHEEGMARRKAEKWNRAQRIFQNSGFQAALDDAQRC